MDRSKSLFSRNGPDPDEFENGSGLVIRIIRTLKFIMVIISLALWITAFLLFKDRLSISAVSSSLFTDLACITFFGGLVLSIWLGALAGNYLTRLLWASWLQGNQASRAKKDLHKP